jgi:hypothetical protein
MYGYRPTKEAIKQPRTLTVEGSRVAIGGEVTINRTPPLLPTIIPEANEAQLEKIFKMGLSTLVEAVAPIETPTQGSLNIAANFPVKALVKDKDLATLQPKSFKLDFSNVDSDILSSFVSWLSLNKVIVTEVIGDTELKVDLTKFEATKWGFIFKKSGATIVPSLFNYFTSASLSEQNILTKKPYSSNALGIGGWLLG